MKVLTTLYFYPRSPCGERLKCVKYLTNGKQISIHALLAESDTELIINIRKIIDFYPRSPCGERLDTSKDVIKTTNFYPRSPCGERLHQKKKNTTRQTFLSTLSLRRATVFWCFAALKGRISIHALLAESDNRFGKPVDVQFVFLSTLSLRRATDGLIASANFCKFLSTLSLRRATSLLCYIILQP